MLFASLIDVMNKSSGKAQLVPAAQDRMRELKAQFDEAHLIGMRAFEIADYKTLMAAIRALGAVISEQKLLLDDVIKPRKRK